LLWEGRSAFSHLKIRVSCVVLHSLSCISERIALILCSVD